MAVYCFSQHRLWHQPAAAALYNQEVADEPANVVSKCHKRPPPIIKEVPKRPRLQPQDLNFHDLVKMA